MGIRALLALIPMLIISCQTASTVGNMPSMVVNSKKLLETSNTPGLKGSVVTPKISSSKDSVATSKKTYSKTRKSLLTNVKEKLVQQGLVQQKLMQQKLVQQKLMQQKIVQQKKKLVRKVKGKLKIGLPPFWDFMNDEHRNMWDEGNPYLRQSLTRYYSDPNLIQNID